MGTSSDEPTDLNREVLEEEVTRLRKLEERVEALETLIGTFDDTDAEDVGFEDVTLAGVPAGVLIDKNNKRIKKLESVVEEGDENVRLGGSREQMLPIHRMWGDLMTNAGRSLGATQKRAARLFGEFIKRVVSDESTRVDASGQKYTLTSKAAEEVLLGKHDTEAENLLSDVKEASRSQVVARAMRDVARLAKFDDCACENIDECQHTVVHFRSGRPNALGAPKQSFRRKMEVVYNDDT